MTDTGLADISEFQASLDAPAYLRGGYTCLIVRAHNGYRPDNLWPARRDYVRQHDFTAIGWYQYFAEDRDPSDQAHQMIDAVGPLRGNEFMILDHEEGAGNQIPRAEEWFSIVDPWQGFPACLYSGASFGDSNLGGWARWAGRPRWIASYPSSYQPSPAAEPQDPHDFWQYTDRASFPGLSGGVDGSIFHGTDQQFLARMRPGAPVAPEPEDYMSITAAVSDSGTLHVFVEASDGSLWYTYQSKGKSSWNGGEAGKRIAGLAPFAPAPNVK